MLPRKETTKEQGITEPKEDWKKTIDVTKECQALYNLPERKNVSIGGKKSPGAALNEGKKDYNQSLKDWARAAPIVPGKDNKKESGAQTIYLYVKDEKIALSKLLEQIYKNDEDKKRYDLVLNIESHVTFNSIEGLKHFYADYLFSKVADEKKKEALADHAILHLHQSGLPWALSFLILQNSLQTSDKYLMHPSVWHETFRPEENGVSIMAEHQFTKMILNNDPEEPLILENGGIRSQCEASIFLYESQYKIKDPQIMVSQKVNKATFSLHDENVKDFIFGIGFVKNYQEKQNLFNKIYEKINEVSKDQKKFDELTPKKKEKQQTKGHIASKEKVKALSEAVEKFKLIDLTNLEELTIFQEYLQKKMFGINRTPETSPSYLADALARVSNLGLMKKVKPRTVDILQELSEFVANHQKKLKFTSER